MGMFNWWRKPKFESGLDVDVRKRELGLKTAPHNEELLAGIYLSEKYQRIIFVPMFGGEGPYTEQDTVSVLPFDSSAAEVGAHARKALLAYELRQSWEVPSPKNRRPWAAFDASGAETKQKFELHFSHLLLETVYASLRVTETRGHSVDPLDFIRLWAGIGPACDHDDLGRLILDIYFRSLHLRTYPKRRYR